MKPVILFCVVLAAACQPTEGASRVTQEVAPAQADLAAPTTIDVMPAGSGEDFHEIIGQGSMRRGLGLCELVRFFPRNRGLYRVEQIVGYTEGSTDRPIGATYIRLAALNTRSEEATRVARILGGPAGPGIMASWDLSLRVGEEVVLLFQDPSPENAGYFGLNSVTVFRETSPGNFSNGQLFTQGGTDADDLLAMIDQNQDDPSGCAIDVAPDHGHPPERPRIPDGRYEGEVEAGRGGL